MKSPKQVREIPISSGVYQIRCTKNGKLYVGSAANLRARWELHRRSLIINQHFAVASGRIVSHRGWTHTRGRKRLPAVVHKGFIAPGGAVVRITNLAAFCGAASLCLVHMHELKSGKRPNPKGWTWKHDADKAFG